MSQDLAVLNKQAISAAKNHMGDVAWPTVMLVAVVLTGFVTNLWLFASGALSVWLALPVLGALTYLAYTPLHEAVHGNIHGGHERLRWLNDLCGYLVAPLIAIPYASHRHEHFTHHRYTNQPDRDPDYMVSGMGRGLIPAVITVIRFLGVQNSFFARQHWATASVKDRTIYCMEVLVSLGWRVVFVVAVDLPGTLSVVVLGYLFGGFFTAYWFAYRPHIPYQEPKRYRNTNSLIMPKWMKPLEWFWMGQNLHSIHHLFPRVPFYRYHGLHREIEPILRAHGTPIVGIFSRQPMGPSAARL
ncbi:fatty acid desaturase family protein [Marinobacter salicampi]|uniref:fatty acid desaturase family protein n=1 Tax=Marinobacter salicampi TaxID=435907 RepID=UPI001F5EEF96|nr:fatty acid desaturase [Marinobacter salicampi]